ncbi:MAG: hypothetical protein EOO09_04975 [Chitinophagaceae bacterium]|nr:MAG: hypothetical protein EOO09_04975 [Chitinophagaceae bacterium]
MLNVSILPPVVRKTVTVKLNSSRQSRVSTAFLLGRGGEQLRSYPLLLPVNELTLDGISAGEYTLRIECGNEVITTQIIIPQ